MNYFNIVNKQFDKLNRLYIKIPQLYYSFNEFERKKKELAERVKLISDDQGDDETIISKLEKSNLQYTEQFVNYREKYQKVVTSLNSAGEIVCKLKQMDKLKSELQFYRTRNSSMILNLSSLLPKIWEYQKEFFYLKKERDILQKEHSGVVKSRIKVVSLRSKVLPADKVLEIKERLSVEKEEFRKLSEQVTTLKSSLSNITLEKDNISEVLGNIEGKIIQVEKKVASTKDRIIRISPKLKTADYLKRLEQELKSLRKKREQLLKESNDLLPLISKINDEEENMASLLSGYSQKNIKNREKLVHLDKMYKDGGINKTSINRLNEKILFNGKELEMKKNELSKLEKEYLDEQNKNREYKKVIEETEMKTSKIKKIIKENS